MAATVQFMMVGLFALAGFVGVLTVFVRLVIFEAIVVGVFGIETKGQALEVISGAPDDGGALRLRTSLRHVSMRPVSGECLAYPR